MTSYPSFLHDIAQKSGYTPQSQGPFYQPPPTEPQVNTGQPYPQPHIQNQQIPLVGPTAHTEVRNPGFPTMLEAHLREYAAAPLQRINIRPEFAGLPQLDRLCKVWNISYFPTPIHDFPDDKFLDQPSVTVKKLNTNEILNLGRYIMPMLVSGFTKFGAAVIFQLAYNLKYVSVGTLKDVFDETDVENQLDDFVPDYFGTILLGKFGEYVPINPENAPGDEMEAAYYCYVSASLFRLIAKAPYEYVRAWGYINQGFIRFYASRVPIVIRAPNEDVLVSLQSYWKMDKRFLFSLYKILYASGNDSPAAELRRFLYEIHLSLTGLHVVGIFTRLMLSLNCSSDLLLRALNTQEYSKQLKAKSLMLRLALSENPEHAREMWTYGRLFDEAFFADFQTKHCLKLAFSLATALMKVAPREHEGILNIKVFQNIGESMRHKCDAFADKLVKAVRMNMDGNVNNNNICEPINNLWSFPSGRGPGYFGSSSSLP